MPYSLFTTSDGSVMDRRTDGVAVTGANTYYSKPVSGSADGFSLHLEWSGTPDGSFTVWKSDKPQPNPATDADWVQDMEFNSTGAVAAGGVAGKFACSALNCHNRWWRVRYVNAATAGTISCFASINCA